VKPINKEASTTAELQLNFLYCTKQTTKKQTKMIKRSEHKMVFGCVQEQRENSGKMRIKNAFY